MNLSNSKSLLMVRPNSNKGRVDNLIDNVCAAKETYLSNNVKGVYAS